MIIRRDDWELAMAEAFDRAADRPFSWGSWDCVHFVSDVVEAMTGVDPMADYRGAYADEAEAWAVLSQRDGNLRGACRRAFGREIRPSFARRGDVVMPRGGLAVGVCIGAEAAFVSPDGEGLVVLPMREMARAFPIGWSGDE